MGEPVRIVLKEAVARPGETLTCVVLLDPHDERVTNAKALDVRLVWRAWRTGMSATLREHHAVARWSAESPLRMEYTVPLAIPADAPVTYRGRLVLIDWVVIAELDAPVSHPVRVLPRGAAADSSNARPWQVPNPLEREGHRSERDGG